MPKLPLPLLLLHSVLSMNSVAMNSVLHQAPSFFKWHNASFAHSFIVFSPHQLQSAPFVCFLSSSSFISNFCFCFLLSFPLAEIFHFWFATRGFLRAFFLLHFCGSSLPSSLPIFALVFCWVFVVMHVFFLTDSYFFLLIFPLCFWFLFYLSAYQAIDEEASCRQVFFPFPVVHVCFGIICLYFQGFNFVCCYACWDRGCHIHHLIILFGWRS